jgi:uncharacterized caspase-like protein
MIIAEFTSGLSVLARGFITRGNRCLGFTLLFVLFTAQACAAGVEGTRKAEVIRQASVSDLQPYYSKSWAIVIGVDKYPTGDYSTPNLRFAVSDAKRVAKKFEELGFKVNTLLDEEATRRNILQLLEDIGTKKATNNDRILFYFAGHGTTKEKANKESVGYILPHDYSPSQHFATAISLSELKAISSHILAKHMLYLMDSCFSGDILTGLRSSERKTSFDKYIEQATMRRSHVVISAGGKNETAKEEGGGGIFTSVLLEALSQPSDKPWANDGFVTATELALYVKKRVPDRVSSQTPQFGNLDGEGDFVVDRFQPLDTSSGDERASKSLETGAESNGKKTPKWPKGKVEIDAPGF